MKRPKKANVLIVTLACGMLGMTLGTGAGVLYSFGGLIHDLLTTGINEGTFLAFGALIGMPVIFAGFGLAIGLVGSVLYNGARRVFWR